MRSIPLPVRSARPIRFIASANAGTKARQSIEANIKDEEIEANVTTNENAVTEIAEEAKADFMKALQECRDDDPNNKALQDLTFTYKYDVQAFFKEFSFLNATEIARRAGINPSLMRQYVSGVKTAGEKTYQRLNACMSNIKADLQAAVF